MVESKDSLTLKWGTLKAWNFESEKARKVAQEIEEQGLFWSMSAMSQVMTDAHKKAVCDLIDALDCETVHLDWDGKDVSKDEAKKYVMEYKR
jgi:hypothetical protein